MSKFLGWNIQIKIIIYLLILTFLVACGSSPNTGISNNPNFIKGRIVYSDNTPIENACVVAIHEIDSFRDVTDEKGDFSIDVDEEKSYLLEVSILEHVIFKADNISPNGDNSTILEFKTEYDSIYYADSVINKKENDSLTTTDTSAIDTSTTIDTSATIDTSVTDSLILSLTADNITSSMIRFYSSDLSNDVNFDVKQDGEVVNVGYSSETVSRGVFKLNNIKELGATYGLEQIEADSYKKVILQFSISRNSQETIDRNYKIYKLLKDWDTDFVCGINAAKDEKWNTPGIGFDNIDAEETPFLEGTIPEVLVNDTLDFQYPHYLELDLTEVFNGWLADESSNHGFVITIGEDSDMSSLSNSYTFDDENATNSPMLKLYE